MKLLLVLSCLAAAAYAKPTATLFAPVAYAAPLAVSSVYHSQNSLGQYNYGYINGMSSKAEAKSIDGVTRGGYSYVDAEGKLQTVQYTSDALNGFRVAATNLPVAPLPPKVEPMPQPMPVKDTPEVAAAKSAHLAALELAKVKAVEPAPVTTVLASPVVHTYGYDVAAPLTYAYPAVTAYTAPWITAPSVLFNAAPVAPVDTPEMMAKVEDMAEKVKAS